MKRILQFTLIFRVQLLFFLCLFSSGIVAQSSVAKISEMIDQVNLDTLVSYVRVLSGEDPVNGRLIINRISGSPTYEYAKDYINQTLKRFGLITCEQDFTGDSWMGFGDLVSGKNIYAVQKGVDTTEIYIICAHYDASVDHGADDNASGTAVVLEAARILSRIKPGHSVIYAFWDQEEAWMVGSSFYAFLANSLHQNIQGVLNLDMIGWDGNNDGSDEIHTRYVGSSPYLGDMINTLNSTCSIGLNTDIWRPGLANSDHIPFLRWNYPAILLIEAFTGDFNPYYHTADDRISRFNLAYYHKMAKLAVAGILSMSSASILSGGGIEHPGKEMVLEKNYPNPVSDYTIIRFYLPESAYASLNVYSLTGLGVASLVSDHLNIGSHQVTWKPGDLPPGIYFCKLQSKGNFLIRKMVVE